MLPGGKTGLGQGFSHIAALIVSGKDVPRGSVLPWRLSQET
jgi:hypothetical protein